MMRDTSRACAITDPSANSSRVASTAAQHNGFALHVSDASP